MAATAGGRRRLAVAVAVSTVVALALSAAPVGPAAAVAGGAAAQQAVVRTGTVRVLHEDDFAHDRSNHRLVLRADGKDYLLKGVDAASGPKAGATVRVAGAEEGSTIDVSGITTLAGPPAAAAAEAEPPVGVRETAVVLFNFTNNAQRPFTAAEVLSRVFTGPDSTNAFYKESSNGSLSLAGRESPAGDVFGWYTIPHTNTVCDPGTWADAAMTAAAGAGHPLSGYDNVLYIFPKTASCPWGGQAYIGTGPYGMGEAWSNGYLDTGVVSHELGHNLGMNHASTLQCIVDGRRVTVADGCTPDEYGDPFDVMGNPWAISRSGNSYGRQPHAWHREQAALMPGSAVSTVTTTGDYTLAASGSEAGTRSLRVALKGLPGWYYYLELRAPEGRFDDFPTTSPAVRGVSIRLSPDTWQLYGGTISRSYLLDATPETATFDDAPLPVGKRFEDLVYGRLAMTVTSVTGGVATIHVDMDVVRPLSVVSVDPPDLAAGVALDAGVAVTLSRAPDAEEISQVVASFALTLGGTKVLGSFQNSGSVLTFRPATLLSPASAYEVTVATDVFSPGSAPWRSTFRSHEGNGPKVVALDPPDGAVDVAPDRNMTVTFGTAVDRQSAQAAFSLRMAGGVATIAGAFSWNAASTVMTFDPSVGLFPAYPYRIDVSSTVRDPAGATMATGSHSTFVTVDPTPRIVAFGPGQVSDDGAPVDGNVTLTFLHPMNRNSVQSAFRLAAQATNTWVPGAFTWDTDSKVMTFNPSATLTGSTWYAISVGPGATSLGGVAMGHTWESTFFTDFRGPTPTSIEPADGATEVAVDRNVVMTFSEPMDRASAEAAFSLRKSRARTTQVPGAFTWNTASTVLTFNPSAGLSRGVDYVAVLMGSARDISGNGAHRDYGFAFTTAGVSTSVVSADPSPWARDVPVDRNVLVAFSEPMDRSSAQAAFSLRRADTTANITGTFRWDDASRMMTFDPAANLLGNGSYDLTVTDRARDATGSEMAVVHSSRFLTDATSPAVSGVTPAAGATGVAVGGDVVVTFSEPMDRNSVPAAFSLRRTGTATPLGGAVAWDVTSTVMTFNPYANLVAAGSYTVAVAGTAKDVSGNAVGAAFASSFTSDAEGPAVTIDPADGVTGVPVDRNVVVTFSEPVERNSAQSAFSLRPAGSSTALTGAFSWNVASTVLTFNPYANLAEATPFTVAVASAAKDVAGNPMAAARTSTFGTAGEAPSVASVSPATGSTGVAVDRDIVVTFSEPVERNSAQVAFSLRPLGSSTNVGGYATWNAASTVMTFNPHANLLARTTYTLDVGPSVKDLTGALSAPFAGGFATDAEGPTVAVNATAGATGVAVDRDIVVTFSEPVDRNTAQAAFSLRKTGTTTNLGGTFAWDPASRVMTFNPWANLAEATGYSVSVAATVRDIAGNTMAGPFSSTFTTDGRAPTVSGTDPAAGATGVAVDRSVAVTFSEPMERSSAQAAFSLRKAGTTVNLWGYFAWNATSTVMTFDPYANLLADSGYTVGLATSAKDTAGTPLDAASESGFTTDAQAPTVSGTDPAPGATGVSVDRNLVVTFSEPVERNSAQAAFSLRKAGTTVNLGGYFAWNATSTVLTFDPWANLAEATGYSVWVAATVRDIAGNTMAGPFSSTFTTDGRAPTVSGTDPAAGATGVAVDRSVAVTFSEPMERSSAQAAFSLRKAGTTVNLWGYFAWNATSTVMTFDPYANLLADSGYTVGVAISAKDTAGTPLASASGSSFTTDAQGPTVVVDAASGATAVAVDRNVVVTYSEPVERNSAQAAFSLRPTGAATALAGAFTWNVASTVMTFNPYANLAEATGHTVSVATTVRDIAGNAMARPFTSTFTTDGRAPSVTTSDPAAGATGVAVDHKVVVTFSEPMERNSVRAAFSLRKAGTTVNLWGYVAWNATSTAMTFDPYANLLADTGYTVGVAPSAKDAAGTPLAAAHTSSFTTDARAPTVSGTDPAPGAIGVSVDHNVVVTFSEPVERNSAQAAFSLRPTGATTVLPGAFTWNVASTAMTFNPYANLAEATGHTVSVAATVKDIAGNAMAGPFTSTFTSDGRAPSVTAVEPATGATGVAVDRRVVVTFSEPMDRNSVQTAFSLRRAGTTVNLWGYFAWNATSTVMTFDPYANLVADTGYTVGVAPSARDAAGTPLALAGSGTFTTAP